MNRFLMLAGVAGLALIASTTAYAQAGSGGAAGGQSGGATQSTPASNPNSMSVQQRLNSGDFVGGAVIQGITVRYETNRRTDYPRNADGIAVHQLIEAQGYRTNIDPTRGFTQTQQGMLNDFRAAQAPVYDVSNLPQPTAAPGSRPVSAYEQAQTASIEAYRDNLTAQVQAGQQLADYYEQNNDAEHAAAARDSVYSLRRDLQDVNQVLSATNAYDGRAFPDESSARSYVDARERLATAITGETTNNVNTAQHLEELANATSGGRALLESNGELRASMDRVRSTEQAMERSADHIAVSYPLRGLDSRTAPVLETVEATNARYGSGPLQRGSIGEVPGVAVSSESGSAGRAAGQAAADAFGGTRHSSSGPDATDVAADTLRHGFDATADALDQPEPVPTHENYPTVSAEERARISRDAAARRQAQQDAANAAAAAERAAQAAAEEDAAWRVAAAERARVNDENHRLMLATQRQIDQDTRWLALTRERFGPGAWNAFADGRTVTVLQLEAIYQNYDPNQAVPPARSLSSAGNSLSSVGWSLSLAGLDYRDPAVESLNQVLYQLINHLHSPFDSYDQGDPARAAQEAYNAGPFDVRYNRDGRESFESGGYLAANLYDFEDKYLRELTANGLTGLDALLAQPFNVILTWGAGADDLDLHMTGPLGENTNSRFHIYYAATGDLQNQPYAQLIKDCICSSGSEVILTSALNRGGVYRVSAYNFGDQSAGSSNLSNESQAKIQIVRGGTTQSVGNGTTITGGHTILTTNVPNGGQGNTWVAVELDPKSGRITVPARIQQSASSNTVQ